MFKNNFILCILPQTRPPRHVRSRPPCEQGEAGVVSGVEMGEICGEKYSYGIFIITWILHESEAFICKTFNAEAIVNYASALITPQMEASGLPCGWK